MANEYLKRTPTSTGNRQVWTWSGWVKVSDLSSAIGLFGSYHGSSSRYVLLRIETTGDFYFFAGNFTSGSTATTNTWVNTVSKFRDFSGWMHITVVYDTTLAVEEDRFKLYVNGVNQDLSRTGSPSQNSITYINSLYQQTLGAWAEGSSGGNQDFEGRMFDVFLVDGQALTPDVFGFYKDGDGYISAGSTQATDFRPGQWVPKSPSVIKNVINDSGGFGVNGYYLPMNDSSNNGADFHCDPNSIITLKGEDLPQPRNGAPVTTDAYVSQLRSDPYAANLVLAVPGIALENTNTELVTNGTFNTGISGWTGYNSTPTWDSLYQRLAIDASTEFDGAETSSGVSVSASTNYTLEVDVDLGTAGGVRLQVRDSANSASIASLDVSGSGTYAVNFASGSNTSVYVRLITSGGNTGTAYFDNVSLKLAVPVRDYSADIKGSGTNKTLTAVGGAGVGYELGNYYGSAMTFDGTSDYLTVPNTSDLRMGSDDFTIEAWVNKGDTTNGGIFSLYDNGNDRRSYLLYTDGSGDLTGIVNTSGDSSANTLLGGSASTNLGTDQWHHCALEREGSYVRLYLNGVVAGISTNLSGSLYENTVDTPAIGTWFNTGVPTGDIDGSIQDLRVYKGVAKYKGGFDVPKPYTPVGIATWRATTDTTANNFAALSPLSYQTTGTYGTSYPVLSDGNLKFTHGQTGQWERSNASFGVGEGKWYFEFDIVTRPTGGTPPNNSENWAIGIRESDSSLFYGENDGFEDLGDHVYWIDAGTAKIVSNQDRNAGSTSGISGVSNGDIINIAFEKTSTTLKAWFGINGTYFNSGDPSSGTTPAVNHSTTTEYIIPSAAFYQYTGQSEPIGVFNFGQNPTFSGTVTAGTNADDSGKGLFKYAPPTGFLALCEDNLPTPAIADPGDYFKTVLYTGDGNTGHSVTGVGFKPDLVWIKSRTAGLYHLLTDSVRGVDNTLSSNSGDNEAFSTERVLNSFDNDGFSLNADDGSGYYGWNVDGQNMVAWCWKAGSALVANTDGSITSHVSANQTAGFSIVSYTGNATNLATVGHGLNKEVKFMITKSRTTADNWVVHTNATGTQTYSFLNTTAALTTDSITAPTSSVFYRGTSDTINGNNLTYVSYCWTEIEGFSKFGSYTGNGSADGPFVYCGFKPAWVMTKRTDQASNWLLHDSSRDSVNPVMGVLNPNTSAVESRGSVRIDLLSNGFKNKNSDGGASNNYDGVPYIFMAFAESPFKTANAK